MPEWREILMNPVRGKEKKRLAWYNVLGGKTIFKGNSDL